MLKISNCFIEGGDSLEEEIKHFWDLETLGIKHDEPTVYEKFIEDIRHNGERYEVKLPFKEDHPLLPDNYHLSKMRLESLLRRLKSKPEVLKHYDEVVKEQLERNIIEPVNLTEQTEVGKVHYLPHRENIRLDKDTTKLRVVYDASAKHHGPSLNNCLYSGPPLTPMIFDLMTRFRAHKVARTADIEKAFLNIAIAPEHRDFLRFLWFNDILTDNPKVLIMRFTRVVFRVNSSPFLLNGTIIHHLNKYMDRDGDAWLYMEIHRYTWLNMDIHDNTWIYTGIHGYAWAYKDIHGYTWLYMDIHDNTWVYIGIHGHTWLYMDIHGYTRVYMDIHGYTWLYMDIHDIT